MSESCENCRFWLHNIVGDELKLFQGQCRAHPPAAGHGFPGTYKHDWCGEWQENKEVPPSRGEKTLDSLKLEG